MLRLLRVVALSALAALALPAADAAGVCYSPFYSSDYSQSGVASLLERDFAIIASQGFDAVRTYHAQFYGHSVVDAAQKAGLKIAIGIQMQSSDGDGVYEYMDQDIEAAISAAKAAPNTVAAIYAGNENLLTASGAQIATVIARVKAALQGTAGANVPVGTVQRLEEWLNADAAASVAAVSDVVGANMYPFFTTGGASDMKGTLSAQWSKFAAKYGGKARLTETGWPSQGPSAYGNTPSQENAAKYFAAFTEWTAETPTSTPFYFMMFDVPTAAGQEYEKHFGVATSSKTMKFSTAGSVSVSASASNSAASASASASASSAKTESREIDLVPATVGVLAEVSTPAPTEAPATPEPTTVAPTSTPAPTTPEPTTPAPTTSAPTPLPTPTVTAAAIHQDGSSSGSHASADEIVFPDGSHHGNSSTADASVGDGSAGVPEPTTATVPVSTAAPTTAAATAAPVATTLSPEAQAEIEAKEANSKVARDIAGDSNVATSAAVAAVGVLGVAAMVVIGVYMRRRNNETQDEGETRTVAASSIDPRGSTPSVYDDPLGTRFSSIVMLTPNGDGVCIL